MSPKISTSLQIELRETLAQPGCPLCRLMARDEAAFLDSLTYERVLDLNTRAALQKSRGLCRRHAHAWREVHGCALGIALVYEVAIKDLLSDTAAPEKTSLFRRVMHSPAKTLATLEAEGSCPVCAVGQAAAERFADVLLRDIQDPDVQTAFEAAGGLCLPHLRVALGQTGLGLDHQTLLAVQRRAWGHLRAELQEFIRKHDYRFQHEPMGDESDSWLRALDALTGAHRKT